MIKESLKSNVHELNHMTYEIGDEIGNLQHIKNTLGRIAIDANEKIDTDKEKYFLWDNYDVLQIINDYLYHVMEEVTERQTKIEAIANDLFDEIVKGKEKKASANHS